uniref:Uncharacterized protein n=1 Tax=Phaeomonas parva TaxID=124430 RepID=A0A7S1U536_9STRA|mmetsp:Transcript_3157/g.9033  ORF Transcript_3157/g.9033 Transcript_3157/m.9033 type:complete len:287 (+) Transcript_3157:409-1269(+)
MYKNDAEKEPSLLMKPNAVKEHQEDIREASARNLKKNANPQESSEHGTLSPVARHGLFVYEMPSPAASEVSGKSSGWSASTSRRVLAKEETKRAPGTPGDARASPEVAVRGEHTESKSSAEVPQGDGTVQSNLRHREERPRKKQRVESAPQARRHAAATPQAAEDHAPQIFATGRAPPEFERMQITEDEPMLALVTTWMQNKNAHLSEVTEQLSDLAEKLKAARKREKVAQEEAQTARDDAEKQKKRADQLEMAAREAQEETRAAREKTRAARNATNEQRNRTEQN